MKHLDEIDATITNSLVNYTIDRLSYVDRAIIRNAIYEMKYEMLPKNIVIDEALLITREYSNLENDAQVKFNNRLLDNIAKNIYD
jgi:N utilization substance protein B